MHQVNYCFQKVNKDCLKFIKSQETSKDKFKNKKKMIKSFLIPISFWISKKVNKNKPYFVGLAGGQGTGKTTISSLLSIILRKYFDLNVFKISIDDFYQTRSERIKLSKKIHPMLATRGVPGTHDINIMLDFFRKSKSNTYKSIKLPKFDKSTDDRCKKKYWYNIKKRPDVIIFEGWCVGARSENKITLKKSKNTLERFSDKDLIWRKYVNNQLKNKYKILYNQLNCLLYLKASNFKILQKWRLIQEKKLKLKNKKKILKKTKIMSRHDVLKFMRTYQRITENMFKKTPNYCSILMNLNKDHQIKSVIYKSK